VGGGRGGLLLRLVHLVGDTSLLGRALGDDPRRERMLLVGRQDLASAGHDQGHRPGGREPGGGPGCRA
jgi:hypothetical protein